MRDSEAIEMMRRSSDEIKGLRARIAALEPKAHAYDMISAILGLLPQPSRGYGEDVAWMLDKRIRELKEAQAKPEEAPKAEG